MPTRQSPISSACHIGGLWAHADERKTLRSLCGPVFWRDGENRRRGAPSLLACVFVLPTRPLARMHTVPLSVCSADQGHETTCNQSSRLPSRTIFRRPALCNRPTAVVLDTKSPAAHHSPLEPASPFPVFAAMVPRRLPSPPAYPRLTARSCRRLSYNEPSKAFPQCCRSTRRPCAFV